MLGADHPQRQPLGGLPPFCPVLQCPPLGLRQHQRLQPRITHAISRPQAAATSSPSRKLKRKPTHVVTTEHETGTLARVDDLRQVIARIETLRRRTLMTGILDDVMGGAQALSELDFTRQVVRAYRLPEPSRQVARRDSRGRRRWTDVMWDDCKVAAEIDGAQHTEDPLQRWDDMERDNDLNVDGYRTLRFPAWLVRQHPGLVARQIRRALRGAGYRD